jgi:hypothetical protein
MAMSLKEVSTALNNIGWKHRLDEEDNVIVSMGGNATSDLMYFTRMRENGEMFDMAGRIVNDEGQITAKGSPHTTPLMAYLLLRNYETKFGTWEFDNEDGTISFAVEIPLEDNKLTEKQLKRITKLMNSAGEEADNIKHILEHGSLPLDGDDAAKKIAELEAMLAQLQGSGI